MTILKTASKVIRIETFLVCLSGVLILMNALEVKLLSLISFLILTGSSILFLLMDAQMVRVRNVITRTQGLQITGLLFILGLGLLYSPITILQMTALDPFDIASLILGTTLLLINSILFVALWVLPRDTSSG